MKKRTFYMTLGLFLLFFNFVILIVTTTMLKDNLQAQKERCLAEHYVITSSLIKDFQALEARDIPLEASLKDLLWEYSYFSQDEKLGLAIWKGDHLIYSNPNYNNSIAFDPSKLLLENRLLTIQGSKQPILNIAGHLPEPFQEYSLSYQFDISEDFTSWRQTKNRLVLTGGIVSILMSFSLFLLIEHLFLPLRQISDVSRQIAAGDYSNRLPLLGNDELTELSRNFNYMAEEVENKICDLQNAAQQKQQFIDNFAHELRTPLTTIYGYTEYIQKASTTEEDRYFATSCILSECKRMKDMAWLLLDLAMLRGEQLPQSSILVTSLFELVRKSVIPRTFDKNIHLIFQSDIHSLTGNQELLQNLLTNLIDNAIKACDSNGSVCVCAYRKDNQNVLSVQDNGRGMSEEQLCHVKEAFYRVDKARSRKDGGAGLGLTLCEQIAQIHNAMLQFLSEPGHGTTVKVIFTTS